MLQQKPLLHDDKAYVVPFKEAVSLHEALALPPCTLVLAVLHFALSMMVSKSMRQQSTEEGSSVAQHGKPGGMAACNERHLHLHQHVQSGMRATSCRLC